MNAQRTTKRHLLAQFAMALGLVLAARSAMAEDLDRDLFDSTVDCDDNDPRVYPGAPELCDGQDNNCDGIIDEMWEQDDDGDGFAECQGDCDDANPFMSPGLPEVADGIDNNCDAQVDEGLSQTWYLDSDGDQYGAPTSSVDAAVAPQGYVALNTDCDDANAAVFPGATEIADGLDNDCDGVVDEGVSADPPLADVLEQIALVSARITELEAARPIYGTVAAAAGSRSVEVVPGHPVTSSSTVFVTMLGDAGAKTVIKYVELKPSESSFAVHFTGSLGSGCSVAWMLQP